MGVWLDSPMIDMINGEGTVRREFPGKYILFSRYGIDIAKEPMLVYPTLHYQNGGLEFKATGETVVPGLFAAGEVAGGIHGENRLMGNSLLDVCVFGRIAGRSAAAYSRSIAAPGKPSLDHVRRHNREVAEMVGGDRVSPMLLPDYIPAEVKKRELTTRWLGTIR